MSVLNISPRVYSSVVTHAKNGYPNEACGILAGSQDGQATEFFPMANVDYSSISYFMDPKEQLRVFKQMREMGLKMTGIFHSHVASEAYPSAKDVRLAFYNDISYMIISLSDMQNPVLRSFRIENDKVSEEAIEIAAELK